MTPGRTGQRPRVKSTSPAPPRGTPWGLHPGDGAMQPGSSYLAAPPGPAAPLLLRPRGAARRAGHQHGGGAGRWGQPRVPPEAPDSPGQPRVPPDSPRSAPGTPRPRARHAYIARGARTRPKPLRPMGARGRDHQTTIRPMAARGAWPTYGHQVYPSALCRPLNTGSTGNVSGAKGKRKLRETPSAPLR